MKSQEHRKNLSKALTGVKKSDEHCKNISLAKIGKKLSEEQTLAIKQGTKNRWNEINKDRAIVKALRELVEQELDLKYFYEAACSLLEK